MDSVFFSSKISLCTFYLNDVLILNYYVFLFYVCFKHVLHILMPSWTGNVSKFHSRMYVHRPCTWECDRAASSSCIYYSKTHPMPQVSLRRRGGMFATKSCFFLESNKESWNMNFWQDTRLKRPYQENLVPLHQLGKETHKFNPRDAKFRCGRNRFLLRQNLSDQCCYFLEGFLSTGWC